jgi:ABC-2 type transport system ATP-binding protein
LGLYGSTTEPVVAENLVKTFHPSSKSLLFKNKTMTVRALDGVSLRIGKGECFGLLGPNGAGKTTLVKVLTTLLIPDSGRAFVNGYDVVKEPEKVLRSIGVMLTGERTIYWKLTGRENLTFFGKIHGLPDDRLRLKIEQIVKEFGLQSFVDRMVETYSSGQRVILSFCKSLLADAQTIFLDEPTISLDPSYAAQIRDHIKHLTKVERRTIILTTQLMQEADLLCDRIALLNRGKIVAMGTPAELKGSIKKEHVVRIKVSAKDGRSASIMNVVGLPNVSVTDAEDGCIQIELSTSSVEELLPILFERLVAKGFRVHHVYVSEVTLEDVFNKLVSGGA